MTNKETRDFFSSVFESYGDSSTKTIILKEVRTRFGGVVKESLTFTELEVENIPASFKDGDYVPFVANLRFDDVSFLDMNMFSGVRS